jgi:hypothetical protein
MTRYACQQRTGAHFFQQICRGASLPLVVKLTISFTNVLNYKSKLKIYLQDCQYPLPEEIQTFTSYTPFKNKTPPLQNPELCHLQSYKCNQRYYLIPLTKTKKLTPTSLESAYLFGTSKILLL